MGHNNAIIWFFMMSAPFLLMISVLKKIGIRQEYFYIAILVIFIYVYLLPVASWLFFHRKSEELDYTVRNFHVYATYSLAFACILIHLLSWFGILNLY